MTPRLKVEPLSKLAFVTAPPGWSIGLMPAEYVLPAAASNVLDFSTPAASGLLAALLAGSSPPSAPSVLDFSIPTNSGLLAALIAGSSPASTGSTLDFSSPTNSGLIAALAA